MKRLASVFIILLILASIALVVNMTVNADNGLSCAQSEFKGSTPPTQNQSANAIPVVFVHGWTGNTMGKTAKLLQDKLPGRITPFLFNYSKWSSYWASDNHIAPCLADYVNAVSKANSNNKVGGDGKVIIVAHSMGGLALRYATNGQYVQHPIPAGIIPLVITIDTPYLGSPWGGSNWAYLKQIGKWFFGNSLPNFVGTDLVDGGRCLIEHMGTQDLPPGCGELPPYLPKGVKLFEIAGNITVHRSIFGITFYTLPLNSDGIVTVPSQQGYLTSGPNNQAPSGQVIVHSSTIDCTIDTGTIIKEASNLSILGSVSAFRLDISNDFSILKDLQDNNLHSTTIRTFLLAATEDGSCSHTNITTNLDTINQMASIIKSSLTNSTDQGSYSTSIDNGQAMKFISEDLGISFIYPGPTTDPNFPNIVNKTEVKETGDKVYLFDSNQSTIATDISNGSALFVEVFKKDPSVDLTTAIQTKFLNGISNNDCFIVTPDTSSNNFNNLPISNSSNVSIAAISYPGWNGTDNPNSNINKCPKIYTDNNGTNFFFMLKDHPDRFLYINGGQWDVQPTTYGTWESTIQLFTPDSLQAVTQNVETSTQSSQSSTEKNDNQGDPLCPSPTPGGNQVSTSVYYILCGVNSM